MPTINVCGLVTHQTEIGNRVKLSIVDDSSAQKIRNVFKHKGDDFRVPLDDNIFQIILTGNTCITSQEGKENIECLPFVVGWRMTGKISIKSYSFKSKFDKNKNDLITGATLVCTEIHLGS